MASDTYKSHNSGRSSTEYTYDSVKGQWVPSTSINTDSPSGSGGGSLSESPGSSRPTTSTVATPSVTSKVDSKAEADRQFIEIEINTLTGDLELTSTEKSIRVKVGDTIKLMGLGKYLSGLYFVSAIKRSLTKDGGYSHTFSVLKNGFGDSLKKAQTTGSSTRVEEVSKPTPTYSKGDKIKIVAADAVYSNAHDGVKVPEWVKTMTLTVESVSRDGTRVLLNPINSWTYVKYIQKV